MTSAILTRDELIGITGRKRKSAQARWLKANGIIYRLNALKHPIVGRAYYEVSAGRPKQHSTTAPNWSAQKGTA